MTDKPISKEVKTTKKPRAKSGGRDKGTPNKVTAATREIFSDLLANNQEKLQGWLNKVAAEDPAKALELSLKLAEYVIPKLNRTELAGTDSGAINVHIKKY